MSHAFIEPLCFVILSVWLALRFAAEPTALGRRRLLVELVVIGAAAFVGEMSCVRLYGFYSYASHWRLFVDVVPLAVICIWPVVVRSALDLTVALAQRPVARALVVALLVVVDAALIEPISVATGLWWWSEPGPFLVPVIGVLGWGFFAGACALTLGAAGQVRARALVLAPLLTHALLWACWWGALRWLPRMEPVMPWVVAAWIGSALVCVALWRRPPVVALRTVWLRAPAALFFFALLAIFARDQLALVLFTLAFAPPWWVLIGRGRPRPAPPPAP